MSEINNNGLFDLIDCDVVSIRPIKGPIGLVFRLGDLTKISVVKTRKCSYCYTSNITQGHNCPNCGANR